jgi:hypothetical protein
MAHVLTEMLLAFFCGETAFEFWGNLFRLIKIFPVNVPELEWVSENRVPQLCPFWLVDSL